MAERHRYLKPLDLAAIVTWGAVAVAFVRWNGPAAAGGTVGKAAVAALMASFLIGFLVIPYRSPRSQPHRMHVGIALMILSFIALLFLGPRHSTPVLLVIGAGAITYHLPPRIAVALLILLALVQFVVLQFIWRLPNALLTIAGYLAFQAFSAFASHAIRRAEASAEELQRVNAHLLATRYLLEQSARDGERLRLARDLHDGSGHKLTALKLNLTLLSRDPALADRKDLSVANTLTEELLRDIRSVVSQLRDADGIDVGEAFRRLAQPVPDPQIHVRISADARVGDAAQAEALVRLAQEGITNAVRHAAARNVWLSLNRKADELELAIEDDGKFKLPLTLGNGLRGMRERIAAIGGEIEFGLSAAGGFRIHARVPQPHRA